MKIGTYIRDIKKYGFRSVFLKNFLTFFLVLIIPFGILNIIIYKNSSGTLKEEQINISSEKATHVSLASDNFIRSMSRTLASFENNSNFLLLLQAYNDEYIASSDTYNNIIYRLSEYKLSNDFVTDTGVYAHNISTLVTNTTYTTLDKNSKYSKTFEALDNRMDIACKKTSGTYTDIVFTKKVYDVIIPRGYCYISVNISDFFENLGISDTNHNTILTICKDGEIIVSSDISMIGKNINEYYSADKNTEFNNISYICTKLDGAENLEYYHFSNASMYNLASSNLVRLSIVMMFFILIMSMLISIFISAKFYRPLSEIIDKLQGYAKTHDENSNEITYITSNILNIGSENIALNKEIQDNLITLNNTQLNMLQNQINPHFLHNTLETIKWFVTELEDEDDKASSMIEKLSKILRYSLENNEYIVDIAEEIEYTKTYVEIMRIRYENFFETEWIIDPEVSDAKIMKLSLQPIIENSITHGIIPNRDKKGKLTISIQKDGEMLIASVIDNGVGISEEKIAELNMLINDSKVSSKHGIGITNVNRRIKLIYGDEYGVSLSSDEEKTTVILKMRY